MAFFQCEYCGYSQSAPAKAAGKATKCPKCGERGIIDDDPAANSGRELISVVPTVVEETTPPSVKVRRCDGGSIKIPLSHRIVVNQESTLRREWITVVDPLVPVEILGCVGIATKYNPGTDYSSGGYAYSCTLKFRAFEALQAIEIKFLTFNIWGEHCRTLVASYIQDFEDGQETEEEGEWSLYSENEASELLASIAFVSRVRTASGKVIVADTQPAIDEALRFTKKLDDQDFEPTFKRP